MKLIKGNQLNPAQKREVLRSFVHRHLDTTSKTDDEWINKHAFYVRQDGKLSRKHNHCEPEWMTEYK